MITAGTELMPSCCQWRSRSRTSAVYSSLARIAFARSVSRPTSPASSTSTSCAPEGADAAEYLRAKYGLSPEQLARNRANIRDRGAAVGFAFGERAHVWNTFDAHRLLHWAGLEGKQRELKHALLQAYHGEGRNPGAHDVLVELAGEVGLDPQRAKAILASDEYTAEVRERERHWQQLGINSVPAVIINDRHLISGGQPPEVFEQALRQIAAERA